LAGGHSPLPKALAARLPLDLDALGRFCRRHHVRRLALFGSILRDDFGPESDVDVLVDFEPGHVPGLAFFSMEEELSELAGRTVDLNTLEWLSPYSRAGVAREAALLYDASRSERTPSAHA
jgi:predicted nucleotidyltransferase